MSRDTRPRDQNLSRPLTKPGNKVCNGQVAYYTHDPYRHPSIPKASPRTTAMDKDFESRSTDSSPSWACCQPMASMASSAAGVSMMAALMRGLPSRTWKGERC